MPKPRPGIIAEFGPTRYKNIFRGAIAHSAKSGKPVPHAKYVLMDKVKPSIRFKEDIRHWSGKLKGSRTSLNFIRADFLNNPLEKDSVDELHGHFIFSAHEVPSSNEKHSPYIRLARRYVDFRHSSNLSNANMILDEASRVLRKGGRFVVSDSEIYFPSEELKRTAAEHGFTVSKVIRDEKKIAEYSEAAQDTLGNDEDLRKLQNTLYLFEFVKE